MRLYISADMEGINGVVSGEQTSPGQRGYDDACDWMVREINAAIEGAVDAGVRDIIVNDSHNTMINIKLTKLHSSASLITGSNKPLSMVQGLDESFDGAFFIGYHAKMGTPSAVLDHTFSYSIIRDVKINDVSVGEFGLNAGFAGHHGVRCALVTGDTKLIAEAKNLVPEIESVAVKTGQSRNSAHCYPFSETLEEIRVMSRRAIDYLYQKNIFSFSVPLQLKIEFSKAEMADRVEQLDEFQRIDTYTVVSNQSDYPTLYRHFLAAIKFTG